MASSILRGAASNHRRRGVGPDLDRSCLSPGSQLPAPGTSTLRRSFAADLLQKQPAVAVLAIAACSWPAKRVRAAAGVGLRVLSQALRQHPDPDPPPLTEEGVEAVKALQPSVQRREAAGTTSMFSCLIIMFGPPAEGGGQMPLGAGFFRMRKRSAASL